MDKAVRPTKKSRLIFVNYSHIINVERESGETYIKEGTYMDDTTLLTMREFSKFTGTKQSTLRYYDEIGILSPVSRGENNYRYYIPFQIILLSFINVLIDIGIPLSVINKMNVDRSPESVMELLRQQETKLDYQLYKLRTAYSIIHTYRDNITAGMMARDGEIRLRELEDTRMVLGPETNWIGDESFYRPFIEFCNSARDYRINLRFPIGGMHYDIEEFLKAPPRPNKFFSQDPLGNYIRKAGKYIVAYRRGFYGEFGDLPERVVAFAREYNLAFNGPVFISYLLDEISEKDPGKYVSCFTVSVTAAKNN